MKKIIIEVKEKKNNWIEALSNSMITARNPQLKAFTLAEITVVMLILGLVTAAFAPVITKKDNASSAASVWQYAQNNTDIFYPDKGTPAVMMGTTNSISDSTQYARLVINTQNTGMPNQITFQQGGAYVGKLQMDSGGNLGLGNVTVSGGNSTAIGSGASSTFSHSTAIGAGAATTASNQIMLGTSTDTVYIPGTLVVEGKVYLKDVAGTLAASTLYTSSTDTGTNVGWLHATSSDRRLKNVKGLNTDGLAKVRQLKVYNYTFKKDKKKTPQVGVIAQDLKKIFPNAVTKDINGYLVIRQDDMFYAMLNSIQQLDKITQGFVKTVASVNNELKSFVLSVKQADNKIISLTSIDKENNKLIKEIEKSNNQIAARNKELETRLAKLEHKK